MQDLLSLVEQAYHPHDETRKADSYWQAYADWCAAWRHLPFTLLEIGVRYAGSTNVWHAYFPRATLLGLDQDPCPPAFPRDTRCHFVHGDQTDPQALAAVCALADTFDLVIDDASHVGALTKQTFAALFPHVTPGGLYVLEDYGAALAVPTWPDAHPYTPETDTSGRFPSYDYAMVGVLKQLIDHLLPTGAPTLPIARIDIRPGLAGIWKAMDV